MEVMDKQKQTEELERLEKLEKRIKKLRKKGVEICLELQTDELYHSLSEQYAREDFSRSIEWMLTVIEHKRQMIEYF